MWKHVGQFRVVSIHNVRKSSHVLFVISRKCVFFSLQKHVVDNVIHVSFGMQYVGKSRNLIQYDDNSWKHVYFVRYGGDHLREKKDVLYHARTQNNQQSVIV